MKNSISLALASILFAAPFAASATESNLGYNNIEVGYVQQHVNTGWSSHHQYDTFESNQKVADPNLKGAYLAGAVELGKAPLYAFGSYAQGKDDVALHAWGHSGENSWNWKENQHVDSKEFATGLGYFYRFNPNMNLITELSYVRQHASTRWEKGNTYSESYNGGRVSVGYDAMLAPKLEAWVKASYTNLANDYAKGSFSGNIGLQYKISPMWGITAQGEFADRVNTYKMGVRMSF